MASLRDKPSLAAQLSSRASSGGGSRVETVVAGSPPMRGRPIFFLSRLSPTKVLARFMPFVYEKGGPMASANLSPALTTETCVRGSDG